MKRYLYIPIVFALLLALTCCFGCGEKYTPTDEISIDDEEMIDEKDTTDDEETIVDEETLSFTTVDVNGNTVKSEDIFAANKVTMINVWASWCGPCVGELSELEELSHALSEMDCTLIGILDDGQQASGLESGRALISTYGLTYTVLIPNDEIHSQLSYMYYPTTFFVDSSGRIIGEPIIGAQVDKYLPAIQKLLADME